MILHCFLLLFNVADPSNQLNFLFLSSYSNLNACLVVQCIPINAIMGNEDKHIDTEAERQEHRISLEKNAAGLDSVPGSDAAQKALFLEFASKDEDWKKEMDKKLVRKIDIRLLPILVILYLLNFLDRLVSSQWHHHRSNTH